MMENILNSRFGIDTIYAIKHSTGALDKSIIKALNYVYNKFGNDDLVNRTIIAIHNLSRYGRYD